MGFRDVSSLWSSPRGWKLIALTLLGLTLLLAVPLYELSDLEGGGYSYKGITKHLSKYLGSDDTGLILPVSNTTEAEGSPSALPDDKLELDTSKKPEGEDDKPAAEEPQETPTKEEYPSATSDDDREEESLYTAFDTAIPTTMELPQATESLVAAHGGDEGTSHSDPCEGFPNTDGIMLVMKTGATESFEKLPAHLLTSLQCVPDFLLVSDLEQQIGQYHILDVLTDVKDKVKDGRPEFALYDNQFQCPVSQKDCTSGNKEGWNLDKYKFLHMIERTWELRPNQEWYVFAEADSYVFWGNMIHWLRNKADAKEWPYVGSVAMLKNTPFAHGGSVYVISGEIMKKMAEIPNLADKYDEIATHECCGDYLLALAVKEAGSPVKNLHPIFNGEKPNTLPYGNSHWCQPLISMHHMNAEEVTAVWNYEKMRKTGKDFIQIREMYHEFFEPNLKEMREDWDNLSDDTCYIGPEPHAQSEASDHQRGRQKKEKDKSPIERRAHYNEDSCALVCMADEVDITEQDLDPLETDEEIKKLVHKKWEEKANNDKDWNGKRRCFQWRYHKHACCTQRSFKLGKPRFEKEQTEKWTSGWFVDGINKWIEAKGDCDPEWKDPH